MTGKLWGRVSRCLGFGGGRGYIRFFHLGPFEELQGDHDILFGAVVESVKQLYSIPEMQE